MCIINLYEYYIECYAKARKHTDASFKWCKWYYDEIYKNIEDSISEDVLAQQYNNVMKNAYIGDKLNGIILHINICEFLDLLKQD